MIALKNIISRLKNPSVVVSIASQIISVLVLFNVPLDRGTIITVVTTVCSVLALLGIMSNPDTMNRGYGDDLRMCDNCGKLTPHVLVGDKLVCPECGKTST